MKASSFFEKKYKSEGQKAQRKYPNEELCRFLGRNQSLFKNKKNLKALDIGTGSGSNIIPLIDNGFNVDAIDFSETSINLCKDSFKNFKEVNFLKADMTSMPFENDKYDVIIDIFSSYALKTNEGNTFLKEVKRLLKPGGVFFTYFPSKKSYSWFSASKETLVDRNTLSSIKVKDAPYYGNNYNFRFHTNSEYSNMIKKTGLKLKFNETLTRTYGERKIKSEFHLIEAGK
jgi:ubiquinone/menaquinone biosynthesis C-methylase UbiE